MQHGRPAPGPRASAPTPVAWLALCLVPLALVPGPAWGLDLTRVTSGDPVQVVNSSRAVTWIDADDDGDLDLYVTNGGLPGEPNEYYRNDGGTLVRDTASVLTTDGRRDDGATWGDIDNDGDEDVFTCSWYNETNRLFKNNGDGTFEKITGGVLVTTPSYSEGCSWVDYDLDGDLDLYVANSGGPGGGNRNNHLYRNDSGTWTQITDGPLVNDGAQSRQPSWADYDNDGDPDLYVANEGGQPNDLYRNLLVETGIADFEKITGVPIADDFGSSWSASWADFDRDGDLDVYVGNSERQFNVFYRNQLTETGSATFTRITDMDLGSQTGWATSTTWADWDNDGDQDLLQTNGFSNQPFAKKTNWFYRNDDGVMNRITIAEGAPAEQAWSYGHAWGDYDADGDLDLYVANWFGPAEFNWFYVNEAQADGNHWLQIDCVGTVSNRSAIGARITVEATIGGTSVTQMREIAGSDGHCSQNLRAHFGLGDATTVNSLVVRWPSGIVQTLTSVPADQVLEIVETPPVGVQRSPISQPLSLTVGPNPFESSTTLRFRLATPASVELVIYDALGRRVRSLDSAAREAGWHAIAWDGLDEAGRPAASGVYFGRATLDGARTASTTRLLRVR